MTGRRRIAVIWHEADRRRRLSSYLVHVYAQVWRELGHEVEFVFGCDRFVPADLAILHVDLSVVPEGYLDLARRYPRTVNGAVADIRKSVISRHRLGPADDFQGPVIVKSDLNCAGIPERRRDAAGTWRLPWSRPGPRFRSSRDYPIHERLADVPREIFDDPACVVERFLPERDGDLYCVRLYHFLGDRWTCSRLASPHPIVCGPTHCRVEPAEPHEEIVALRRELRFDYGKFDYVVRDGRAVLLDANKTPGAPAAMKRTPERLARWRERALGILSFLG